MCDSFSLLTLTLNFLIFENFFSTLKKKKAEVRSYATRWFSENELESSEKFQIKKTVEVSHHSSEGKLLQISGVYLH